VTLPFVLHNVWDLVSWVIFEFVIFLNYTAFSPKQSSLASLE